MHWRKVTLLGVGLLGGSLGMALRKRRLADRVHGYVRRQASIQECLQAGAVDSASTNMAEAVGNADLIVLCTPLAQMSALARAALEDVAKGAVVTDVGSVKGQLVAELEPLFRTREATFIGSHPMAGSEKMGVSAAREDLFQNAVCVVTPTANSPADLISRTEDLWKSVGARILRLSPETHDELVARSSHLPHVLAAHLARYVLDPSHVKEQSQLCANGFRDSTRIASGSPEMWRDIVMMNKDRLETRSRRVSGTAEAGSKRSWMKEIRPKSKPFFKRPSSCERNGPLSALRNLRNNRRCPYPI
jgi:prephenate dehydrogenase